MTTDVYPPPGDSAAERVANFLEVYTPSVLQYLYQPDSQWNLDTDDVRLLLAQHRKMHEALLMMQRHLQENVMRRLMESSISLEDLQRSLDNDQH
jgi:hypothetical protein